MAPPSREILPVCLPRLVSWNLYLFLVTPSVPPEAGSGDKQGDPGGAHNFVSLEKLSPLTVPQTLSAQMEGDRDTEVRGSVKQKLMFSMHTLPLWGDRHLSLLLSRAKGAG